MILMFCLIVTILAAMAGKTTLKPEEVVIGFLFALGEMLGEVLILLCLKLIFFS